MPKSSPFANGGPEMAAIIQSKLGIVCTRGDIARWKKAPPNPDDRFPIPTDGNRYVIKDVLAWVKRNIAGDKNQQELFQRAAREKAQDEIDRIAHERILRERELGQYIDRNLAKTTFIGALKKHHSFCKQVIEQRVADVTLANRIVDEIEELIGKASKI